MIGKQSVSNNTWLKGNKKMFSTKMLYTTCMFRKFSLYIFNQVVIARDGLNNFKI